MLWTLALVLTLPDTCALRPSNEREEKAGAKGVIASAEHSVGLHTKERSLALTVHASARFEHKIGERRHFPHHALVEVAQASGSGPPYAAAHWGTLNTSELAHLLTEEVPQQKYREVVKNEADKLPEKQSGAEEVSQQKDNKVTRNEADKQQEKQSGAEEVLQKKDNPVAKNEADKPPEKQSGPALPEQKDKEVAKSEADNQPERKSGPGIDEVPQQKEKEVAENEAGKPPEKKSGPAAEEGLQHKDGVAKNEADKQPEKQSGTAAEEVTQQKEKQVAKNEADKQSDKQSVQDEGYAASDFKASKSQPIESRDETAIAEEGEISSKEEPHEHVKPKKVEIDDPTAAESPISPIDILLGVKADHAAFPDDGQTEVLSELDHAIFDIQEISRVLFQIYDRFSRFTQSLVCRNWVVAALVYATSMFLMLGLYSLFFRYREVDSDQDFHFGFLDCMGDIRICIYGVVCAPIRWADTMQKAGLANFLPAFLVMWVLLTLRIVLFHFFTWGCLVWFNLSIVGAFFRQKIRKRCALEESTPQTYIEDFFAWCCCAEFAVCQEARQVEAVLQQDAF